VWYYGVELSAVKRYTTKEVANVECRKTKQIPLLELSLQNSDKVPLWMVEEAGKRGGCEFD
jgi:hypothetical protein